jgi:hypothetical protein
MCRKYSQKEEPLQQESFDDYVKRRSAVYKLKPICPKQIICPFVLFSCSCPFYMRKAFCKHSVALGIWKQKFSIPAEMSIESLGPKGKRGRKKKVTDACYGSAQTSQPTKKQK